MPSSFTSNLNLEKPEPGEQENIWGGTLNSNFDIIDSAINSRVTTGTTQTISGAKTFTGKVQLGATGDGALELNKSGSRYYFAPYVGAGFDYNAEFGYDAGATKGWYVEGPLRVSGIVTANFGASGTVSFTTPNGVPGLSGIHGGTLRRDIRFTADGVEIGISADTSVPTIQHKLTATGYIINGNAVWHAGNDGPGSGLDADTVDGKQASAFAQLNSNQTFTGRNNFSGDYTLVEHAMRFGTFDLETGMIEANRVSTKFYVAPVIGSSLDFNREFGFVGNAWFFEGNGDGDILRWERSGVAAGAVSVSGSTVTYGSFCGVHWSQLDQGIVDLPVGTVLSTIDRMCEWFHLEYTTTAPDGTPMVWRDVYFGTEPEGTQIEVTRDGQTVMATVRREDNEQLAMVKVSDAANDNRVYGVFGQWDQDGDATVHSLGATVIRVTGPCQGGDLLVSRGDGTAMVQEDDIIRSRTIGKVTVGRMAGPDEVNLVPCVLYCG